MTTRDQHNSLAELIKSRLLAAAKVRSAIPPDTPHHDMFGDGCIRLPAFLYMWRKNAELPGVLIPRSREMRQASSCAISGFHADRFILIWDDDYSTYSDDNSSPHTLLGFGCSKNENVEILFPYNPHNCEHPFWGTFTEADNPLPDADLSTYLEESQSPTVGFGRYLRELGCVVRRPHRTL